MENFLTKFLGIICLFLFVALFGGVFTCHHFDMLNFKTAPIPGRQRAFDPVAALPKVQKFAGKDTELISIYALLVKSDGTMDFKAKYKPHIQYVFYKPIHEVEQGEDVPLGAGRKKRRRVLTVEIITITVTKGHYYTLTINGESSTKRDPGMSKYSNKYTDKEYEPLVVDTPLSFKTIWETAFKKDLPRDAVSIIHYNADGYWFSISDTHHSYRFDSSGVLIE